MVRNDAFTGVHMHNPYNFQHFNVSEISVFVDGQSMQNIKLLKIDYRNLLFVEAFNSLFTGTGWLFHDEGLGIDRR